VAALSGSANTQVYAESAVLTAKFLLSYIAKILLLFGVHFALCTNFIEVPVIARLKNA